MNIFERNLTDEQRPICVCLWPYCSLLYTETKTATTTIQDIAIDREQGTNICNGINYLKLRLLHEMCIN